MIGVTTFMADEVIAQAVPSTAMPEPAATEAGQYQIVPMQAPLIYNIRVTVDYMYRNGPLVDANLDQNGDANSDQVTVGVEGRIGLRGFARIEVGARDDESSRPLRFDDMSGDLDGKFIGASGGAYVFSFLALGVSGRYGGGTETDVLVNRFGLGETVSDRKDAEWRISPFAMLTAPLGPVQFNLLGGYTHIGRTSDFSDPTIPDNQDANMSLWTVNGGATWRVTPDLSIGANVGWNEVIDQKVLLGAVPIDEDWGAVDAHATYQLFDGFEVTLRGGHDFANSQGNSYRIGGGIAYQF